MLYAMLVVSFVVVVVVIHRDGASGALLASNCGQRVLLQIQYMV